MDLAREPDFELGRLKVRPSVRQVEVSGRSETLEPRILQVLIALARRHGDVVSREELIATCWNGMVVGEDSLNRCIYRLRKLGEASKAFEVETIAKVGYRMTVADGPPMDIPRPNAQAAGAASRSFASRRRWLIAATAAGLLLAGGFAAWWANLNSRTADVTALSQRVAFFGFTAADDNPLSARIAVQATDQTFAELTRMRLDAAANTATLGASAEDRLTRANAVGAAYALSGEVRIEGEEARFAIRLEDAATRATLWESMETSPLARPFYSPPKQAAFRAAANTACVVALRSEISRASPEALNAITDFCVRPFSPTVSTGIERNLLAIRSLAELEPHSAFLQTAHASNLIFTPAPADLKAERLREADAHLEEALRITPGYSFAIATAEFAHSARGGSPLGSEQLLTTARPGRPVRNGGSTYGEAFFLYRRGLNLLGNGRTEEGIARLRAAAAIQPSFSQLASFQAYGLASQGKSADAEQLFEQTFASDPAGTLVWPVWARAAVLEGVGEPEAILAAAPENAPRATVACWRSVLAAKRAGAPGPPRDSMRDCGPAAPILAALGRLDEAFENHQPASRQREEWGMLFAPSARAMRADTRFLQLTKDIGLWEYWIETGTRPDVCDLPPEKDFPLCVQLRATQAK